MRVLSLRPGEWDADPVESCVYVGCDLAPLDDHIVTHLENKVVLVLSLCGEHLQRVQNRGDQQLRVTLTFGERTALVAELLPTAD